MRDGLLYVAGPRGKRALCSTGLTGLRRRSATMPRLRGMSRRPRTFTSSLAGVTTAFAALLSVQIASASSPPVAKAVIWSNLTITVSPKAVKPGTVVFKIRNRDLRRHSFAIDGYTSASIKPNKVVTMTVIFKKPGIYFFTLGDADAASEVGTKQVGGVLKVR